MLHERDETAQVKVSYISLRSGSSSTRMLSDSVRKKLEEKNFVHLATVFPNGSPQVTPVWVDVEGKYILVNTAIGRVKEMNVKKNPKVALSLSNPTNQYDFLQVRGKVVEQITGQAAEDHIDKLNMKYHGKPKYNHRPGEHRVILKILPEKISTWD